MTQTFRPGRRLRRLRNFAYLLLTAEVVFFYLVYLYLLAESYPQYAGNALLTVFFAIEAVVMLLTRMIFAKIQQKFSCTVSEEGVTLTNFFGTLTMPWADFESAHTMMVSGRNPCPIYYMVNGRRFMPNQYYADLAVLNTLILDHIRGHAQIEDGLEKALEAYRALKV